MAERKPELTISEEESRRISILKAILIVMVVLIHAYKTDLNMAEGTVVLQDPSWLAGMKYILTRIMFRCAVPGFFFLSAYLLYRKPFSWKANLRKKARSLLIPYFLLNAWWILVFFTGQHLPGISSFFSRPENIVADWDLGRWLSAFFGSPEISTPMLSPLWFVRDLFVLNLLAPAFEWFVRKTRGFSLAVFLILWILLDCTGIFFLELQDLCFWGFGCWFAVSRKPLSPLDRAKVPLAVAYPCLIAAAYLLRTQYDVFGTAVYRLCDLCGLVFFFVWGTRIRSEKLRKGMLFLSRYSFPIFLFHEMHLTFLQKILAKVLPQSAAFSLLLYFGAPAMIIVFCLVLSRVLERFTPKLYSLLTGGRSR